MKSGDYARAGVPMLPNVAGPDETRRQIWLYTLAFVPATLAPIPLGFGGLAYTVIGGATAVAMLGLTWRVYRVREGEAAAKAAQRPCIRLTTKSCIGSVPVSQVLPMLAEHGFGLYSAVARPRDPGSVLNETKLPEKNHERAGDITPEPTPEQAGSQEAVRAAGRGFRRSRSRSCSTAFGGPVLSRRTNRQDGSPA